MAIEGATGVEGEGQTMGEIRGRAMLQVVEGIPDHAEQKARWILGEQGVDGPEPDEWYPMDAWVRTLAVIEDRIGAATVQQIGETVVGNVDWPAGTESFRDAMAAVDRAYRSTLRGADAGGYGCVPLGDDEAEVVCRTPHPTAFDRAVVTATARGFPADAVPTVEDVSDARDEPPGTVFAVSWWSMGG